MLYKILIFLYVLIGLVPYFGTADKIHPQTLYLSILNLSSIILLIRNDGFRETLASFKKKIYIKQVLFYIIFFIFSIVSIYQSINKIQSLIAINEIFNNLLAFVIMIYLLSIIKNLKLLLFQIVLVLSGLEILASISPYLFDIYRYGSPIDRSLTYRGFTGSVNIASYLLLMKLPFLCYYAYSKKYFRIGYSILITLVLFCIVIIFQTRSAILTSLIVFSFIVFFIIYNDYINNSSLKHTLVKTLRIVIVPIVIVITISNLNTILFKDSTNVQDRLSSINIEEYSTNSRIRYYTHAIESIIDKPLTGIGIGNWQLESINKDSKNMESYIVPYHAHNDFLQLAAETGIQGSFFYFLIILSLYFYLFKKIILKIRNKASLTYEFLFIVSLSVYLIDSLFNFPFGRVLQQINLFFFLAFIINFFKIKSFETRIKYTSPLIISFIILYPLSLYSSGRLFKSSIHQRILLSYYNFSDFSLPLEEIDKYEMDYSDLTVTTIPMISMKGFFYMKNNKYREAIDMFNQGTKKNPYLYFSETYKAFSHLSINNIDSAVYFSKIAFDKLPGNSVHFANYALSLVSIQDSLELKNAYSKIIHKKPIHDEMYLTAMSDIINVDETNFALDNYDFNNMSDNDGMKRSFYTLKIGKAEMLNAAKFNELGNFAFENKDFISAVNYFKLASDINPFEFPYTENYANSLIQLKEYEEAIKVLDELIDNKKSTSIKAQYMRVLAYLNMENYEKACSLIQIIKDDPLVKSINLERFCIENN